MALAASSLLPAVATQAWLQHFISADVKEDQPLSLVEVEWRDLRQSKSEIAIRKLADWDISPVGSDSEDIHDSEDLNESPIHRVNTLGDLLNDSARKTFVRQVSAGSTDVECMKEGQTGEVFAFVDASGERVAIFKPAGRENFRRRGLKPGQGAVREEAAYIVDRLCGGAAEVPITTRTCLEVSPGIAEHGALQAFARGHIGYVEDFAMPSDHVAASRFLATEKAEAVAILDMRLFNTDRHGGNLLLTQSGEHGGSHSLVPIDHGCCLPPWWSLGEAHFSAWRMWPQLLGTPSAHARALVTSAVQALPATVQELQKIDLEPASIVTLQACTLFLEVGVLMHGLPLNTLAELLLRDGEENFDQPSWFEEHVAKCAAAGGVACDFADCLVECLETSDGSDVFTAASSFNSCDFLDALRKSLQEGMSKLPLPRAISTSKI